MHGWRLSLRRARLTGAANARLGLSINDGIRTIYVETWDVFGDHLSRKKVDASLREASHLMTCMSSVVEEDTKGKRVAHKDMHTLHEAKQNRAGGLSGNEVHPVSRAPHASAPSAPR